jgi:hypothetical protein
MACKITKEAFKGCRMRLETRADIRDDRYYKHIYLAVRPQEKETGSDECCVYVTQRVHYCVVTDDVKKLPKKLLKDAGCG